MKLQERFSTLSPIYSGGLTNHLPMVITALRLLGVEDEVVEEIAEKYVGDKSIVDLSNSGIENDAFNDEYVRLSNFFLGEIQDKSVEVVLKSTLSENQYSLQSGLFHGLIRIAYAYLENNDLLIAQGLAYFELIKEELRLKGKAAEDVKSSFKTLIEARQGLNLDEMYTMQKINALLEKEEIADNLFYFNDFIKHKEQAVSFFVDYYNKTKDFYILHVITGYHALHVLSQFFTNEEEVFQNFFMQSLVVMLINTHDNYLEPTETANFKELNKKTPELTDAHDIKLFFSLCYFYERYEIEELKIAARLIFTI